MQIKVTVSGYGEYQIDHEKLGELLNWLSQNKAVQVKKEPIREVADGKYTGNVLINEGK